MANALYTVHEASNPVPTLHLIKSPTMLDVLADACAAETAEERDALISIWSDMFSASFDGRPKRSNAPFRLITREPSVS